MEAYCDLCASTTTRTTDTMIFVTVGSDISFNRLVRTVDCWARDNNRLDFFAQIGRDAWQPKFIPFAALLEPVDFNQRLLSAQIIISHAGMGTILSALQNIKPILVMPRRGHLGETRNDHQMATAHKLLELGKVSVAFDESELCACLDNIDRIVPHEPIAEFAGSTLVGALYKFINKI